jgi:hypothetical protein
MESPERDFCQGYFYRFGRTLTAQHLNDHPTFQYIGTGIPHIFK